MTTFSLIKLIAYATICSLLSLAVHIIAAVPGIRRAFCFNVCFNAALCTFFAFSLPQDSPFKFPLVMLTELLVYLFCYRFRGFRLLLKIFICMLCTFCGDIIAGIVTMTFVDSQTIAAMRYMTSPVTIVLQAATGLTMILLALVYRGIARLLRHRTIHRRIGYLLRPVLLMLILGFMFFLTMTRVTGQDQFLRLRQVLPDFIIMGLLMSIGVTYIIQDIRFYRQLQENKKLMHEQSLQSLLLQDTRIFRHNIANMLYGMQGTLLTGDADAINTYYHRMVEQCQMINNENVISLKRLPSMAVSSLLLNKIQQANEQHIPFYVSVSEPLHWHGLRDHEMSQLLGVLIDNALEAARESNAPYVAFEACNVGSSLSLIIRNTHRPGEPPRLTLDMPSTKPGHDGLGLKSVRQMLRRNPHVLFNLYTYGRYVEASILFT